MTQQVKIIVDSGAYSAWRLGKEINLDAYCSYLEQNLDWITEYIALDVINPNNVEEAARASFDNLVIMRKRGLNPLGVLHAGESIDWLHRMLDLGVRYIGIAASSLTSRTSIDDWYSLIFSHLVNSEGLPVVKTHALGEGRASSLKRFPWVSADSTSWVYSAQRGGIATLPDGARIGMRHDGNSPTSAPDLNQLGSEDRAIFNAVLKEHGISQTVFETRDPTALLLRSYMTALFYIRCEREINALRPIKFHPHGFLHNGYSAQPPIHFDEFSFYLVCGTNNTTFPLIAKLGHQSILASYFYIDSPNDNASKGIGFKFKRLREFVNDPIGVISEVETWKSKWDILEAHLTGNK